MGDDKVWVNMQAGREVDEVVHALGIHHTKLHVRESSERRSPARVRDLLSISVDAHDPPSEWGQRSGKPAPARPDVEHLRAAKMLGQEKSPEGLAHAVRSSHGSGRRPPGPRPT